MTDDRGAAAPRARFGIRGLLAFVAVFLVAVPFGIIVVLLREKANWLRHVDLAISNDLHRYDEAHPGFVTTMKAVTYSGSSLVWIVVLSLVGLWLLYRHRYRLAAFLTVTAVGSSLLNEAIKAAVGRARPVLVNPIATAAGKSFPSGHTQAAMVGYGILVLFVWPVAARRWRFSLVAMTSLMVLLVGFSRIALGVHYLSDVIGGIVIGSAWLLAMTAAFAAWRPDEHLSLVQPAEGLDPEPADSRSPDP